MQMMLIQLVSELMYAGTVREYIGRAGTAGADTADRLCLRPV